MIKKNVFNNAVCIGKFNPAILNLNFLEENKIFIPNKEVSKPTITPVMTHLKYDDIEFFLDLNRFQITQKNIGDDFKDDVVKIMYNYLKILQYTPINIVGINFVSDVDIENSEKLIKKLENNENILDALGVKEYIYDSKIRKNEKGFEYLNWDIETIQNAVNNSTKRINIMKKDKEKYRINYNIEIKDVKDFKDLLFFIDNFVTLKDEYNKIISNFFGD
jgi:hypothetical protein